MGKHKWGDIRMTGHKIDIFAVMIFPRLVDIPLTTTV
jgi:hypothetical protein